MAGVLLGIAGAGCWSIAGGVVRLPEGIDAWQIIFYRSVATLLILGAWVFYLHGRRLPTVIREAGVNAVIAGIAVGGAGLTFMIAIFYTTIAQAIFMTGISPFVAALLGWWILREAIPGSTWAAMLVALGGLAVMLWGSPGGGTVIGIVLALYSAFCFSCYSVLLRWGQRTEMIIAVLWNVLLLALVSAAALLIPNPFREVVGPEQFLIGWWNLPLVVALGAIQLSLGLILFTRASQSVPAAELTLLALVEPTFSPLWAWFAVGEVPALTTLLGGGVIMAAIVMQVVLAPRR
jgi:drug/metabolite transporter (DMT)-like permease